jgi:UDP-2-acetamido-2-deoxy-ribo-hexuluronate aminotransferase
MEFIDLKAQYKTLQRSIQSRITKVMENAQFIMGPEIAELETALAAKVGARHCISCASGTDALMLAMMALGIGSGDEVITSPFTFIATAEMIAILGAKPVFVDIDPRTYNIDPKKLDAVIGSRTRAIMPVALYGQCAEMDEINAIAARHNLPVIEDAAQSFGATYKNRSSCNLSTIGCTSFFPSKPLGCYGDGGACFTNDDQLALAMREIRVHGQDRRYHHTRLGFNGRLDTMQAAILLAKLETFDQELKVRNSASTQYSQLLKDVAWVPCVEPHNTSAWAQYTIQIDNRATVQKELNGLGIPTAVHYPIPIHLQPVFAHLNLAKGSFPISEAAGERVLSLPIHGYISESELKHVASSLGKVLQNSQVSASPAEVHQLTGSPTR